MLMITLIGASLCEARPEAPPSQASEVSDVIGRKPKRKERLLIGAA